MAVEVAAPFLAKSVLPLADEDLVGAGLSLFELELCEFDLAFSPLVEEDDSDLLDLRVRLSPGMLSRAEAQSLMTSHVVALLSGPCTVCVSSTKTL